MKKVLIGCLVIAIFGVAFLAVGGYFLYRAASPVIQNAREYLTGLAELGELEKQIANRSSYSAPASGELTEAQMQRFVRVQDSVRTSLGQRINEIEEKYKSLKASAENQEPPSVTDMLGALKDIANVFLEARRLQVNALNQERFSQEEYSWVRDRVFQAAGMEATKMIDLQKLQETIRTGTGIDNIGAPEVPTFDVPEKNRELVKPYLSKVDQWIPLVFFGL